MYNHKIQRWFLFFLFKSKTNKKGKEISNIQPAYESLQDFSTKLLFNSSLTKFHPQEMLSLLAKNDKTKTSTFASQRFHQHYGPSLLRHITQMTEITTNNLSLLNNSSKQTKGEFLNNMLKVSQNVQLSNNQSLCWNCPRTFNYPAPVILAIKKQNISWSIKKKYTTIKDIWHLWCSS
jgi:hypothetical protein